MSIILNLTRLTWLIHTSVLPSNWNPDKIFAPTGLLGQVHLVKKIFLKFLHAGAIFFYKGSPPYAFFGTWKKPCYMKLVLVGLYCGPLLTLIPPLTRTLFQNFATNFIFE